MSLCFYRGLRTLVKTPEPGMIYSYIFFSQNGEFILIVFHFGSGAAVSKLQCLTKCGVSKNAMKWLFKEAENCSSAVVIRVSASKL